MKKEQYDNSVLKSSHDGFRIKRNACGDYVFIEGVHPRKEPFGHGAGDAINACAQRRGRELAGMDQIAEYKLSCYGGEDADVSDIVASAGEML